MKRLFRQMAAFLAFCVLAASVLPMGLAAEGTVHNIPEGTDLYEYLKNTTVNDGDVIKCQGDVNIKQSDSGGDDPWIIDKHVTIDGGNHIITIRRGGILLGADVRFQNAKLSFNSSTRNAIIANGYSLTLDNVQPFATQYSFNVFCGTLVPNNFETTFTVPAPGSAKSLTILGNTKLQGGLNTLGSGNIYAGSLSMGAMRSTEDYDGSATVFSGDVSINIEGSDGTGALGTIYAGGAQQRIPSGAQSGKETRPNANKYKVSGIVTITGTNSLPAVNGAGADTTDVIYRGDNNQAPMTFQNISSLSVESGNLVLEAGSWFRDNSPLSVSNGAAVNIKNMGDFSISDFHGGGSLILGQTQTLTITGAVDGETTVGVGKIFNGASDSPTLNHTYIKAQGSMETSFRLAPPSVPNPPVLKRGNSGSWTATSGSSGEAVNRVTSFQIPSDAVSISMAEDAEIKMEAEFESTTLPALDFIPLSISVNGGAELPPKEDSKNPGYYLYTYQSGVLSMTVIDNALCVTPGPQYSAGTYQIQVTIPQKYNGAGQTLKDSVTLTVTDPGGPDPGAPTVTGISVSSANHKTAYMVGESLDVTNLTIDVTYSDQTKKTLLVTADMVSGFDSTQAGGRTLTVTHKGHKAEYTITVTASGGPVEPGGPKCQVTLNNLGEGGGGAGSYEKGSTVTIRAGGRSGYTFSAWQQPEGVTLTNRTSPETSFTMPGRDVTLLATWRLNGGTTPPGHTHVWGSAWSSNATHHWHDCAASGCTAASNSEKSGYAPHTAGGWVVDRPASSSQSGVRHRSCVVCGYELAREPIPATGGGSSSGGSSSGGSSSSNGNAGSSNHTTTVRNPDGSTTSTNTNRTTGTVTETTRRPDGSRVVVETKKDGTVTTTDTAKDGSTVKTVARSDGTSETTVRQAGGLTATVREDGTGARADVHLSSKVVKESQSGGRAVALPIPELPGENASVTVRTGSVRPVRVEIPVRGDENTTVACVVNGDGTETILKTAVLTGGQITVSVPDGATVRVRDNGKDFRDTRGHWAEDAIAFAAARELFAGKTAATFAPDAPMSRAMLTTVLARLDGVNTAGGSAYEKGMAWAAAQGVSDGRNPEGQVTREQFVTMLHRYAGSPAATNRELRFSDEAAISGYAREAVRWAVENGILSGYGNGSFAPGGKATRAQAAVMLSRYVKYLNG